MNYQNHYERLIFRARDRVFTDDVYVEKHHIIPKCMGGSNKKENIVKLLPEEHFVAHQLLVKIYPDEPKLVYSLHMMTVKNQYQSQFRTKNKEYKWIRERYSIACQNKKLTDEHKRKISEGLKGKRLGRSYEEQYGSEKAEELKKLKSKQLSGRKKDSQIVEKSISTRIKNGNHIRSNETRKKISQAHIGKIMSTEHKMNISESLSGRKLSIEHKKKIIESNTGQKRSTTECPFCNKVGGKAAMIRWHFKNCKQKEKNE